MMAAPSLTSAAGSRYVVYLMDISAVWLIDTVFFFLFCRIVRTALKSQSYFIMLILRLPVTHTIYLHFDFSVSRPGMGGINFPSFCFCV